MGACNSKAATRADEREQQYVQPEPMAKIEIGTDKSSARENCTATEEKPSDTAVPALSTHRSLNSDDSESTDAAVTSTSSIDLASLPSDLASCHSLIQSLHRSLTVAEQSVRAKEQELESEREARAQSVSGVLNQAVRIMSRPSTSMSSLPFALPHSASTSASAPYQTLRFATMSRRGRFGTLQEASREEKSDTTASDDTSSAPAPTNDADAASSTAAIPPNPIAATPAESSMPPPLDVEPSIALDESFEYGEDESQVLRRELIDVLLTFAQNELLRNPTGGGGGGGGGAFHSSFSAGTQHSNNSRSSLSEVIQSSTLDATTKAWLIAEYTREAPGADSSGGHRGSVAESSVEGEGGSSGDATKSRPSSIISVEKRIRAGMDGRSTIRMINTTIKLNTTAASAADASIIPPVPLPVSPQLLSAVDLTSSGFDPTTYSNEELSWFAFKMFDSFDLLSRFRIDVGVMNQFIREVAGNYRSPPYHNFQHGFDVLHCCWLFLRRTDLINVASGSLRSLDLLSFLVSALCHDLGHPGTNNTFQTQTQSELARIYNDASVLENFHAASAFKILSLPSCNIFSNLSRSEYFDARKMIISCILSTDMSHHFGMVSKLDALFENFDKVARVKRMEMEMKMEGNDNENDANEQAEGTTTRLSLSTPPKPTSTTTSSPSSSISSASDSLTLSREDVISLLSVLLHTADISNPSKPWSLAKKWADRIHEENLAQGDRERALGLPVSPFMDRMTENQPRSALGFIDFIVAPLLSAIVRAFPMLADSALTLIKNRKLWNKLLLERVNASPPLPSSQSDSSASSTQPPPSASEEETDREKDAIKQTEQNKEAESSIERAREKRESEIKKLDHKEKVFRGHFAKPMRQLAREHKQKQKTLQRQKRKRMAGQGKKEEDQMNGVVEEAASSSVDASEENAEDKSTTKDALEDDEDSDMTDEDVGPVPSADASSATRNGATVTGKAGHTRNNTTGDGSPAALRISTSSTHGPSASSTPASPANRAPRSAMTSSSVTGSSLPPHPFKRSTSAFEFSHRRRSTVTSVVTAWNERHDDPETQQMMANAAQQLLRSVQTIVKRRHSTLEANKRAASAMATNNHASSIMMSSHRAGAPPRHNQRPTRSQPHTPTLQGMRAPPPGTGNAERSAAMDSLHLLYPGSSPSGSPIPVAVPPPRRLSFNHVVQLMITQSGGSSNDASRPMAVDDASLDGNGESGATSDDATCPESIGDVDGGATGPPAGTHTHSRADAPK